MLAAAAAALRGAAASEISMKAEPLMGQAELAAWARRGGRRQGWHQPVPAGCQDRAEALSSVPANPNSGSEMKLGEVKHRGMGHTAEEQQSPHETGSIALPPSALLSHHGPREAPPRLHVAGRDKQVESREEGSGQAPAPRPEQAPVLSGCRPQNPAGPVMGGGGHRGCQSGTVR